jgi:hypothetical protein
MSNQVKNINILEVSQGAIREQIDIEIKKLLDNLLDPNTDYKAGRALTIKLKFKNRNDKRDIVDLSGQAQATLAPSVPISASLYTEYTKNGIVAAELTKPDPNQISIDEERGESTTNIIDMKARAK